MIKTMKMNMQPSTMSRISHHDRTEPFLIAAGTATLLVVGGATRLLVVGSGTEALEDDAMTTRSERQTPKPSMTPEELVDD